MKTKLDLAHDHIGRILEHDNSDDIYKMSLEKLVGYGFDYADAMYAEMEKREDKSRPDVLKFAKIDSEWSPNWSQAPENAVAWAMDSDGCTKWHSVKPTIRRNYWVRYCDPIDAPSFNYKGDWRESLRERP